MHEVLPQNEKYLRDAFGAPLTDGACVRDPDGQVGYVRLDIRPVSKGPDSLYWDGWFNVTRTRHENPLRGKVLNGERVELMHRGSSS